MPEEIGGESRVRQRSGEIASPAPSGGARWLPALLAYLRSLIDIARWSLAAGVLLMTVTSLTEGLGVALLFPILQVAGFQVAGQGHVGHYTAEVERLLARSGIPESLWLALLLGLFVLLFALRSLFSRVQSVLTFGIVVKYELALSRSLFEAVARADWMFLAPRRSSEFAHALTGELTRLSVGTYMLIGALSNAILALFYIAIALKLSAQMTLLVLAGGMILLLFSRRWLRAAHETGSAVSESMREVYAATGERLQNLKTMKAYGAQDRDLAMLAALQRSAGAQSLRNIRSQAAAAFWFEAGSLFGLGFLIFASLSLLRVAPASILLLLAVFTRLMPRLAAGNNQLQGFLTELPAFERIMEMRAECAAHAEPAEESAQAPALRHEVRLEEVCFRYGPADDGSASARVLDRASLSMSRGRITALAGPSGAGKSTVADLVNGLLTPESGRILIDGLELEPKMAPSWRRQVGYVGQDTPLFHDTVRANLLWAQPGSDEEQMRQALRNAAADFVFGLPGGLDAVVGDRGALLSTGQRQRIGLARALLRTPALLILDEATSGLDLENERKILDVVAELKRTSAILLIAHRPSAIERADLIYVLEQGRIVESGGWAELCGRPGARIGGLFRLQDPGRY